MPINKMEVEKIIKSISKFCFTNLRVKSKKEIVMSANSWLIWKLYNLFSKRMGDGLNIMMVLFFVCVIVLYSCKSQQPIAEKNPPISELPYCLLKDLPITTDYKNRIEEYTSIYKDTIFEIESAKHESNDYKTMLELRASERYLWLIRSKEVRVDSFLIHCFTSTKSVEIEFNPYECKLETEEIEYNEKNGEPIITTTRLYTLENWLLKD